MSFAAIRLTLIAALLASGTVQTASATATAETALPSVAVRAGDAEGASAFDGVVQAQRQTAITAQVAGAIVALQVKAGDTVRAGQVLLRLDARAADQVAAAGAAQVE
ncbi:MAG: biotin/lipoyl-binding protein, partial [Burkholderiales bacterium]|nr:biotin/lipoyl-binding protein [Burkholderiales bacterium]